MALFSNSSSASCDGRIACNSRSKASQLVRVAADTQIMLCRSWRYFDSRLSAVRYLIAACAFYGGEPLSLPVSVRGPIKLLSESASMVTTRSLRCP